MAYDDMSPLSWIANGESTNCPHEDLVAEIQLFRKALQYCKNQEGDDNCWMDYRHMLMRFLPGYDPATDDVALAVDQKKNCDSFIDCWQKNKSWDCLGGDKGKTIEARTIGTLDCLEDRTVFKKKYRYTFEGFNGQGETVFPKTFIRLNEKPAFHCSAIAGEISFAQCFTMYDIPGQARADWQMFVGHETQVVSACMVMYDGCGTEVERWAFADVVMVLQAEKSEMVDPDHIIARWVVKYKEANCKGA